MYLNQDALKARKITLLNVAQQASPHALYMLFVVPFEIVEKRKQPMKPSLEINDYEPSTI